MISDESPQSIASGGADRAAELNKPFLMDAESRPAEPQIGNGWDDCGIPEVVLRALFKGLDAAGVDYCVMRNFDLLPASVGNSDLDILLSPKQHLIAERTVRRVLEDFGGAVVARVPARGSYLKTMGCTNGRWWGLAIDLVADVDFRGMIYITAEQVLSRSVRRNGVRVASAVDAALGALSKELINNLSAESRYVEKARMVWCEQRAACLASLACFCEKVREMVGDLLEAEGAPEADLRKLGQAMRLDLENRQGLGQRLKAVGGDMLRRMSRVFRRPGALIVLSGDDAASVRETLERALPVLKRAFHKRVLVADGEPGILAEELTMLPHDSGGRIRARGVLFRYGVNYFRLAYPRMMGKPHLICSIGYFDEFRHTALPWRVRFIHAFLPKPDLVLNLSGKVSAATVGPLPGVGFRNGVSLVPRLNGMSGPQASAVLAKLLESLSDRARLR